MIDRTVVVLPMPFLPVSVTIRPAASRVVISSISYCGRLVEFTTPCNSVPSATTPAASLPRPAHAGPAHNAFKAASASHGTLLRERWIMLEYCNRIERLVTVVCVRQS